MVIDIKKSANEGGVASIQEGKLFLVDLAGYEQAALIGTDGMLQQETKHINETLLGLNRSICCCSDPKCAIKGEQTCDWIQTASYSLMLWASVACGCHLYSDGTPTLQAQCLDVRRTTEV